MRRKMICIIVLALRCQIFADLWPQSPAESYYPLEVGYSWRYLIHEKGRRDSYVTWKVTAGNSSKDGAVFQVWPKPMDSDDDALTLISANGQVRELNTNVLLVKGGLKAGEKWDMRVRGNVVRRLAVIDSGNACRGYAYSSADCVTIEDVDDRLHLRTITRYAKGIGPVKFEYYSARFSTTSVPDSVAELVSYHFEASGTPSRAQKQGDPR